MDIEKRKSRYHRKCYRCGEGIEPKEEYYSIRGFLEPIRKHGNLSTMVYSWTPFCVLCGKVRYASTLRRKGLV